MVEEDNKLIAEFMGLEYFAKAKYKNDLYEAGDQAGEWEEFDIYVLNPTEEFKKKLIFGTFADEDHYNNVMPYDKYFWGACYDTSWDWLMPVYQKIVGEDLFGQDEEGIILFDILYDRLGDGCIINEVYDAIIVFIKWHNKQREDGKD